MNLRAEMCRAARRARLMAKSISDLSMHRIDQCLGQFSGFIEQREIGGWLPDTS